jgi:hypothetical protein
VEENKKIKQTAVGEWLKEKAPHLLDKVGDLLPDNGVLGVVKRLVDTDPDITPEQKMEFEKLQSQIEIARQENVTRRWEADMSSDVQIAKVIRPSIMIALLLFFMVITVWDAMTDGFMPRESFVDLLQVLMLTVFGAYFAGRTIEKTSSNKK